jgi:hypothetical protein
LAQIFRSAHVLRFFHAHLGDSGLPDGLFSNQNSQFGQISEDLKLENIDIFYCHSEYFTNIWDIFYDHLVHFSGLASRTKKNLATPLSVAFSRLLGPPSTLPMIASGPFVHFFISIITLLLGNY